MMHHKMTIVYPRYITQYFTSGGKFTLLLPQNI